MPLWCLSAGSAIVACSMVLLVFASLCSELASGGPLVRQVGHLEDLGKLERDGSYSWFGDEPFTPTITLHLFDVALYL